MKALTPTLVALTIASVTLTGCTASKRAQSQSSIISSNTPSTMSAASDPSASTVVSSSSISPTQMPTPTPTPTATASATAKPSLTTTPTATATTPSPAPPLVQQLASVGNATQVIVVTANSWTTDVATVQTFQKSSTGWHPVFAAMPAHIGRAGFSANKHEGDLKTPAGRYSLGTMFGQRANPGVKFPYRQADSQSVWVDDVTSPYYNTWQENAALKGEHLSSPSYATAYAYAVAIDYNTNPIVAGKGSAIFLHVSTGGGTAGCVSVAQSNLLQVLRWLDPAKSPIIVMGPTSVIRQY